MPVTNDNYDQLKIDKLKYFLETQAQKGIPKPYEIFVDNLKVVARTEDPAEFDSYEFYMNEDTEKVRILIYNSNLSPRNDQYCFLVQNNKTGKSLNGLGDVENIVQEKLAARDREHEMNRLREELEATKEELAEAEEFAETLQKEIVDLKTNKFKLGNLNLGELASVALEGIVRRNPQMLNKLPGGEALAGIIQQDNKDQQNRIATPTPTETETTFQRKDSNDTPLSELELRQLSYLKQLEETFDQPQAELFNIILGKLVSDPGQLPAVAKLLNIKHQ